MTKEKNVLSLLLCLILVAAGLDPTTISARAETAVSVTPIETVSYEFTVSGVTTETSLEFQATTSAWETMAQTVLLNGDGDYTFTMSPAGGAKADGMVNLGFVTQTSGSSVVMTLNSITVNGSKTLYFENAPVISAGAGNNALANIWNTSASATVCSGENAYLAVNAAGDAIVFYTGSQGGDSGVVSGGDGEDAGTGGGESGGAGTDEGGTGDDIKDTGAGDSGTGDSGSGDTGSGSQQSTETVDTLTAVRFIKYDFTVTGTSGQTSLEYTTQATNWISYKDQFAIDGDGDYSLTLSPQAEGLTNLGHFTSLWGSTVMVALNKVTVNDTYEMTFESSPVANLGTGNPNGYANIWNTSVGTVICRGADCRMEYTDYNTGIAFYVESGGSGEGGGDTPEVDPDRSLNYVAAMGHGWNLGNSFDGFEGDLDKEDTGELAWSNPAVTKELLAAVKQKGFDSIRIPMTVHRRYTVNENAGADGYKYVIDREWLARYREVVDWAAAQDLYVMINIHHDSWIWLQYWDGSTVSEEYRMFTDFWKQISEYFADCPDQVCFETINEPAFEETGGITGQQKLDALNRAAYDIIRGVEGNETRMLVFPTYITNHEKSPELYQFLQTLKDNNVIATVHYYSDWVFSANLGKTGFDEELWKDDNGDSYTPRKGADIALKLVYDQFVSNKIGVVIGEYGILGYDRSDDCNQMGEELKYYEYVNELARQYGLCLMFWDNGSGIDRKDTADYSWKKAIVGNMLEASMNGRSSYAAGLDSIYFDRETAQDVSIPLTLNGNTFTGIDGLTEGQEYTYNASTATVTLKQDYVNRMYREKGNAYGTFATLVFTFSSGADWYEYLVKYTAPVFGEAQGTTENISIPVTFNGSKLRRVTAYQTAGRVGPNSDWWQYLQYDDAFTVDYQNGLLSFTQTFFNDPTVRDGVVKAVIEFYDGQFAEVWMDIEGGVVTSSPSLAIDTADIGASGIICLYAGETAIPSQYIYMPEGGSVYGTWVEDSSIVQMSGWPAVLTFDTVAHANFTIGGLVLYYMDAEVYANVQFGIKDAPVVTVPAIGVGETKGLSVSNLAYDAAVSYEIEDTSVAEVSSSGYVTGKRQGSTMVLATVTQYNRTDTFRAVLTVQ